MWTHETFESDSLVERIEVEQVGVDAVFRRYNSVGTLTETRPATVEEQDALTDHETLTVQDTKRSNVENAVATLRTWAQDAQAVTVTPGNAVNTLQTVVDRLGVFFDRFADLVESKLD